MVNIDISASGNAAGAIAAAQAAIDSLHGKTVEINVKVNYSKSGDIGAANAAMRDSGKAADQSAAAHDRASRASDRSSASARAHASASERASGAMGGLGSSSDRAGTSLRGVHGSSQLAGRGLAGASKDADKAGVSLGGLSQSSRDADKSAGGLGRTVGGVGRGLGGLGDGASGAGRGLSGLGRSLSDVGISLGSVPGYLGSAAGAVGMFGTAAAYAAAGSGILTAGVGALGAVGVGALGGVGVAAGMAGGAMANFAVSAHQDSAKFGKTFASLGKQAHLAAQMVSEPMAGAVASLGRSMVTAEGNLTGPGMAIASSLQEGFGNAAGVINSSSDSIVSAAAVGAAGFARLTGETAPGASAFLSQLPSLTAGAVSGLSQITSEFGASAGAIEGATPAINRMTGSLGGLGAQAVRTGAGSIVPFAENVSSMANGVSSAVADLAPAIKPSMQAVTDVVNAVSGGLGSLAPDVASFAGAVSANAPQLESIMGSAGRGMLAFGSAAVNGLGSAAPAISSMANSIQANQPAIAETVGWLASTAASAIGFGADVIGVADSMASGATGRAIGDSTRGPDGVSLLSASPPGGIDPGRGGQVTDSKLGAWVNKTFGLTPSSESTGGGGGFFGAGGTFDRVSKSGGLLGLGTQATYAGGATGSGPAGEAGPTARGQAMAGQPGGGLGAAITGGAMSSSPFGGGPGGGPGGGQVSAIPRGGAETGGGPPTAAQSFGGLFTGAMQSASQAGAAIPATMQTAMAGARSAVSGANLGGAAGTQMSAMSSAISSANVGGSVGGQMNRMTQTVESAAPAAAAAGAKAGGAIGGGVAAGTTSSMTVMDKLMIKHVTSIEESAMSALDAHSPSRKFAKIGTYIPLGMAEGIARMNSSPLSAVNQMAASSEEATRARTAVRVTGSGHVSAAQAMAQANNVREGPRGALRGAEKQQAFAGRKAGAFDAATRTFADADPTGPGATINSDNARMVFDKQVMSWNAAAGSDIGDGKPTPRVASPLTSRQYDAMVAMQSAMDGPVNDNFRMFGERTEQNILRNRPGALNVADAISDHEKQAQREQVQVKKDGAAKKYNPFSTGTPGSSFLSKDTISMVRQASGLGEEVSAGFGQGVQNNAGAAVNPIGNVARAQKKRYTDDWDIHSPSGVAAGYGVNIMQGLGGGISASQSLAVGALSVATSAMQAPMSDFGLKVGYAYGQSIVDGSTRVMEKAQLKALGQPKDLSKAAMSELAMAGMLRGGSGASTWKTPSGAPGTIVLQLPEQHVQIGDQVIATIADRQIELAFDAATSTYQTLRG